MEILKKIGQQLDMDIYPSVGNSGIVAPNINSVSLLKLGKENKDATHTTRRSETRKGTRTTRWPWQTCKSQAYHAPSVVSPAIKTFYEKEITEVREAYPGTQVWQQNEGMWLLTESSVLADYWHSALFITAISFVYPFNVRSWGFWTGGLLQEPAWIGPRHTNFPDGSVCAFEPSDGTWLAGQPIIPLLDMYTLWALRHLHLEVFGRWPGHQSVHHPYERVRELRADEFCGCDQSHKLYGECCQKKDLARDRIADAINFRYFYGKESRKPPISILNFIRKQEYPPPISELLV